MGNKLRNVFNKNEQFIKGTIGFKDAEAALEFREALKTVYKEGRTVPVKGVESMAVSMILFVTTIVEVGSSGTVVVGAAVDVWFPSAS